MIEALNKKAAVVVAPGAIVDNASWTSSAIDTLGAAYLEVQVNFGAMDIAMTALKLQECETSGGSYADISGATFASSLPSATSDNTIWTFFVPIRGKRMRYVKLVATGGDGTAGTYMSAVANLYNLDVSPTSATERGLGGQCILT